MAESKVGLMFAGTILYRVAEQILGLIFGSGRNGWTSAAQLVN
jgi:hypothetical protein